MRAWLRRNRWFLVALAVLIPVALVVSLVPRFFRYLAAQPSIEYVERGDSVRYAGTDFEVFDLFVLDGGRVSAPAGTDVVVVGLRVDVVDPPDEYCTLTLISDESGVEREWDQSYSSGDVDVPDEYETSCDLTEPGSYELVQTFLVPHGEVVEPVVQVSTTGITWGPEPHVVRLR